MHPLSPSDRTHLSAAVGWLGLRNWREANDELESISAASRAHPDVLQVRCKVCCQAQEWEMLVEVGRVLSALRPKMSYGAVHQAHAFRQLGKLQAARDVLLAVSAEFTDDWRVAYHLACYYCKLGDRKAALGWLEDAIERAGSLDIRLKALDEPDLVELWADISTI